MTRSQADIIIVGLGPGAPDGRTIEAQRALDSAERLYLRTARHPGIEDLTIRSNTIILDETPERHPSNWSAEVAVVCDAALEVPVVLGVPGHPLYGERLVIETVAEAERRGLRVTMIEGLSVIDMVASVLGSDPMVDEVQIIDARQLVETAPSESFAGGHASFTPLRPLLCSRVYGRRVSEPLARLLARTFPSSHPVTVIEAAGIADHERIEHVTVGTLGEIATAHLASVWVPPLGRLDAVRDPRTLQHIVARLRQPDGCPWDLKQTNATLRDSLIDEVYEVVDAIDAGDMENLAEELGDLFLLIAMHAQIAEEAGHFTLEDIYEGIATKIVRRHPHVFGDRAAHDAEDVAGIWRNVKATERAGGKKSTKVADGQPHAMPALERATRVLKKRPRPHLTANDEASGERLLDIIAGIIDAGDDPDTVLRAALEQHVASTSGFD